MKKYEMVFVLQADEPESEMESRVAKIESVVAENGGEVTEKNHWGVRQLAYEIRHETRGDYMHLLFKSEGPAIATLDNEFRLDHKVLRHLLVLDEEWQARNAANRARRPDLAPIEPPRLGAKPSAKPIAKAPEAKAPETKAPVSEAPTETAEPATSEPETKPEAGDDAQPEKDEQ